jgi:hypothetical protein
MNTIESRLDKAKGITGSDGKTALRLMMSRQHLCDVRNGRRSLTIEQTKKLSALLDEDFYSLWGKISAEWKSIAACLILGLSLSSVSTNELQAKSSINATDDFIHYAKFLWGRMKRKVVDAWNSLTNSGMLEYQSISCA